MAWLLNQKRAALARAAINGAKVVVTSSLTLLEAESALLRAESRRVLRAADAQKLRGLLQRAQAGWMRLIVSEEILARAARPFPAGPVRTRDAIHLATALAFSKAFSDLRILTFDPRIQQNAVALGLS